MSLTFLNIADDDTGACDIAGMLAGEGMRTIVVLDSAAPERLRQWAENADAIVLATASRAVRPQVAYRKTREALELIRPLTPKVIGIKYCSTFDSTPEGNIGTSIDAAMDVLDQQFTVAVPALPVNGRTTYMGYHYVGRQLLSDSSMRLHPLNPMTNPNLVSHLQSQTQRRVGLAAHPVVRRGVQSLSNELSTLRQSGVEIAVIDCTCDADLEVICAVIAEMPLITGSSGPAIMLPAQWKRRGYWSAVKGSTHTLTRANTAGGTLIVSGSCSEATRRQGAYLEAKGIRSFALDGVELAAESFHHETLIRDVIAHLKQGESVLVKTITGERQVHAVQQWALTNGCDAIGVGLRISRALGSLAREIFTHTLPQGLIIAGGETSSIVCRMLGVKALSIGRNVVPGVPLCASITAPEIPLVLKSGNFGGEDFFMQAIDSIQSLPPASEKVTK